jgi:hypothetical protein
MTRPNAPRYWGVPERSETAQPAAVTAPAHRPRSGLGRSNGARNGAERRQIVKLPESNAQ